MNLTRLSVAELLKEAYLQDDPLVSTPLEQELRRRLQDLDDRLQGFSDLETYLDDTDRSPADVVELLKLLDERGAESVKALTDKLDRADRWFDLANEAGDMFARLEQLRLQTT